MIGPFREISGKAFFRIKGGEVAAQHDLILPDFLRVKLIEVQ